MATTTWHKLLLVAALPLAACADDSASERSQRATWKVPAGPQNGTLVEPESEPSGQPGLAELGLVENVYSPVQGNNHQIGQLLAGNASAWSATEGEVGFLLYGPYQPVPANIPQIGRFILEIDQALPAADPNAVAYIDVSYIDSTQHILASRTLTRGNFQSSATWQVFDLPFVNPNPNASMEFRVYSTGSAMIAVAATAALSVDPPAPSPVSAPGPAPLPPSTITPPTIHGPVAITPNPVPNPVTSPLSIRTLSRVVYTRTVNGQIHKSWAYSYSYVPAGVSGGTTAAYGVQVCENQYGILLNGTCGASNGYGCANEYIAPIQYNAKAVSPEGYRAVAGSVAMTGPYYANSMFQSLEDGASAAFKAEASGTTETCYIADM